MADYTNIMTNGARVQLGVYPDGKPYMQVVKPVFLRSDGTWTAVILRMTLNPETAAEMAADRQKLQDFADSIGVELKS
jgi:predicted neuraminidase